MGRGRAAASILRLGSARERGCDDILNAVRVRERGDGAASSVGHPQATGQRGSGDVVVDRACARALSRSSRWRLLPRCYHSIPNHPVSRAFALPVPRQNPTRPHQAASRHSYRWWRPPMRGSEVTVASGDGGRHTARVVGGSLPRDRCVRSPRSGAPSRLRAGLCDDHAGRRREHREGERSPSAR